MKDLIGTLCAIGYEFDMAITIVEAFTPGDYAVRIREEKPKEESDND